MKNILIITSSGGGGLLQSAVAKEQQLKEKDPTVKVITKDILLDWTLPIGYFGKWAYNWTQKTGRVFLQGFLARCNVYADILLFPMVFYHTFKTLKKEKNTIEKRRASGLF